MVCHIRWQEKPYKIAKAIRFAIRAVRKAIQNDGCHTICHTEWRYSHTIAI